MNEFSNALFVFIFSSLDDDEKAIVIKAFDIILERSKFFKKMLNDFENNKLKEE